MLDVSAHRPPPLARAASRLHPGALADALAALPVRVLSVRCRSGLLGMSGYPGGRRPAGLVVLEGDGHTGYGEHVAFSEQDQRAFACRAEGLLLKREGRMGELIGSDAQPYERAALEGALIDLGLRQAGASLGELCGAAQAPLRWVASFGALEDPVARLRALRAAGAATEFKVDVHGAWTEAIISSLAAERGLVILDFKGAMLPQLCARLSNGLARVTFEDPPAGCPHRLVARDAPLLTSADVQGAVRAGEAVNIKAPRMGGFLAALRALEAARALGGVAYFGGMFEAGPGREQARQLAALFCGEAPNDLGPLSGGASALLGPSPSTVRLDGPGFGGTADWGAVFLADRGAVALAD
jgi:L-alanine-DL-glutamate epimerase-like enolase superfamily enzyme